MKVLIGCEYSGIVRDAFLSKGHDAMSVDLIPTSVPGPHFIGDAIEFCHRFKPDIFIVHPPCQFLCNGQMCLYPSHPERKIDRAKAVDFVRRLWACPATMIALENPKGYLSSVFKKPDQIIYPFQFGDPYRKDICLWLKNLPPLISTCYSSKRKSVSNHVNGRMSQAEKSKIKSKFFPGIAAAMACQWS